MKSNYFTLPILLDNLQFYKIVHSYKIQDRRNLKSEKNRFQFIRRKSLGKIQSTSQQDVLRFLWEIERCPDEIE